jgi:hypothetical protein
MKKSSATNFYLLSLADDVNHASGAGIVTDAA